MQDHPEKMFLREVRLALRGPAAVRGVSVNAFSRVLHAYQRLVYQIATYLMPGVVVKGRGDYPDLVKSRCELILTKAERGSLVADLRLREAQQPLIETGTWGHDALRVTDALIHAAGEEDLERQCELLIQDHLARLRALSSLAECCPREEEGFTVEYEAPAINSRATLDVQAGSRLKSAVHRLQSREVEIIGPVTGLRLVGNPYVELATTEGNVKCFLDRERAEQAAHYIEHVLRVHGTAKIDLAGRIRSIESVSQIQELSWEPYSPICLQHANLIFRFFEPLSCRLSFEGAHWYIECPQLAIYATADSRDAVIAELAEEFAFLWREYAEAKSDVLTPDARDLKNKLLSLVEAIERL